VSLKKATPNECHLKKRLATHCSQKLYL